MSGRIKIYARIRPTAAKDTTSYTINPDSKNFKIHVQNESRQNKTSHNVETSHSFKFDKVYDVHTNQQTIFNDLVLPSIKSSLSGYNTTVFAYGQTGSGKTFTITGGNTKYQDRGVIPRALEHIFQNTDLENTKVSVSYIEIYNENGYDLLDSRHDSQNTRSIKSNLPPGIESFPKIKLYEDSEGSLLVKRWKNFLIIALLLKLYFCIYFCRCQTGLPKPGKYFTRKLL